MMVDTFQEDILDIEMLTKSLPKEDESEEPKVIWEAQEGSQRVFLDSPVFETLYDGTRGNGKTDSLIMDFLQHVGRGYGPSWRGILFRRTYPQLKHVISKTKQFFPQVFPRARFNNSDLFWQFPQGETLYLRHLRVAEDYWNYHGHEYPWIAFEELTSWPSPDCYELMKTCCRSDNPDVPRKYRSTTNSYGPGFHWVKRMFVDPAPAGTIIEDEHGNKRIRIKGIILENKVLLSADPSYLKKLLSIADPNKRKAWAFGSWDIVAGAAISHIWDENVHILKPFNIPRSWKIDRSFDWGYSAPFSVGWWAVADGSLVEVESGKKVKFPPGTLFRIGEWYGASKGEENTGIKMKNKDIAKRIKKIDESYRPHVVLPGPADRSIWSEAGAKSIAAQMEGWRENGEYVKGVDWLPGIASPGSRIAGLGLFLELLSESLNYPTLDSPGFFVFDNCKNFIRLMPNLPISESNPDDIDTESEDHIWDETRYRLLAQYPTTKVREVR